MNKRSRAELYPYFVTNAVPTESDFRDLVDGMLNRQDDGIDRPENQPLRIEAFGGATSPLLDLYESFGDASPEWTLSLRPRITDGDAATERRGLAITDANNQHGLFLERGTARVGVGTLDPSAKLHVGGDMRVDGPLNASELVTAEKGLSIASGQPVSGIQNIEFQLVHFPYTEYYASAVGASATASQLVTFSQPVVKAAAVLTHWHVGFRDGDSYFYNGTVLVKCDEPIDNSVKVNLVAGCVNLNRKRKYEATALVIAVLQNAV